MSKHVPPPSGEPLDSLTLEAALTPPGDETLLSDLPRLRKEASEQIEFLIALLDATEDTDTQCDDERIDDDELEPSLGSLEGHVSDIPAWRMPDNHLVGEDRELDESDKEPSLGSGAVDVHSTQSQWAQGRTDDVEDEHGDLEPDVDEPSLGSTATINQEAWAFGNNCDREQGTTRRFREEPKPASICNVTPVSGQWWKIDPAK